MNSLEWIAGYNAFMAFASWARRHNFYVDVLDKMEQSFKEMRGGK